MRTDDNKIHRQLEIATLASVAAVTKDQMTVTNPPGTRRKRQQAKQRRKLAKKSRKRNQK